MKKLLLISVVMVVVGLGLILYSDPIVTLASGNGQIHSGVTTINNPNVGSTSGSGSGPVTVGSSPTSNGASGPGGFELLEYLTIAGIAFCAAGIFLTAVEAVSRSSVAQTKTVT